MPDLINAGDTAWMMVSAALGFLMIPGFALFYGGLTRQKNVLGTLVPCFMALGLVSLQWVLFGYSLSFGPDHGGWIGTLAWVGLRGVGAEPNLEYAGTIPQQAFMIYHMMLAVIAATILLSSFVERIRLRSGCVFALLWSTCVYDPVAHWVWAGGGFLRASGTLDFAGGSVVHVSAGMSALAMALVLGKRRDPLLNNSSQHFPFTVLGAVMLWFSWPVLNAGSALSCGAAAVNAFAATHVAALSAALTWAFLERLLTKRPTLLGIITGAAAGLVAVTPAAGFVSVWGALTIGLGASLFCYAILALTIEKLGADNSLYAIGVHGIGGIWGMIATGLWATKLVNYQPLIQLKATLAVALYSFGMSWALLKCIDILIGLRALEP